MKMRLAIVFAILAGVGIARAQDYPARAITMVVPYPPGGYGTTMVMARAG